MVFTYLKEITRIDFDEHIKFFLRTCPDQVPDKRCKSSTILSEALKYMMQTKEMTRGVE
jgi:hypothetical protein